MIKVTNSYSSLVIDYLHNETISNGNLKMAIWLSRMNDIM